MVCFYTLKQRGYALGVGGVCLMNFEIWCTLFSLLYIMTQKMMILVIKKTSPKL